MTRALGTKGLQLTELGFGGGAIGGLYAAVGRDAAMSAIENQQENADVEARRK